MSKVVYEKGTWGTETSYVPTGKEREIDSQSSGERNRKSLNQEKKFDWGEGLRNRL